MKKKICIIFLCLLLMGVLSSCDWGKESKYTGKWSATTASCEEVVMDLNGFLGTIEIELASDGKATVILGDEKGKGKWSKTEEGIKIFDSSKEIEMKMVGNSLVVEDEGVEVAFERQ